MPKHSHSIRAAAARATKVVSVLQDLSGPKIRTGRLKDGKPIELKDGQTIRIRAGDGEGDARSYLHDVRRAGAQGPARRAAAHSTTEKFNCR